jgi:hypothetical protein
VIKVDPEPLQANQARSGDDRCRHFFRATLSRSMVSRDHLMPRIINRDQYASFAARSCAPNRTLWVHFTDQREQALGQQSPNSSSRARSGLANGWYSSCVA